MFSTDKEFEDEVRRIGRLLWPEAEFDGAAMEDGRERDGIFVAEEFVHCVECTVSRQKAKAVEDVAKLEKLLRKLRPRYPTRFIKGWFITLEEPTADQREVAKKSQEQIVAVSYDQFRSKLVDARSYLQLRQNYPFGSVRDPATGAADYKFEYVPLEIAERAGTSVSVGELALRLERGERFVLTGDYGAGKSSTVREVFRETAGRFWSGKTCLFPTLLNLRDHHGQTDPTEALERHGRAIGLTVPSSLVRAWRAGYAFLLLDGFDEIAAAGWTATTKRLKDQRFRSMSLVRQFVRDTPAGSGLLVAGRAHFFDTEKELETALGVPPGVRRLELVEFTDEQVRNYLARFGWVDGVPEWLPTRPLLLGYLAARHLLHPESGGDSTLSPAAGWNALLGRIASREAEIEPGVEAGTVRELIERLATLARSSGDGLGPITVEQILGTFSTVCGYAPDDRAAVLLQRLPGLGAPRQEDGSRVFIDKDFVEAARGGDLVRTVADPYNFRLESEHWLSSVSSLAAQVAAVQCEETGFREGRISAALEVAARKGTFTLAADLVQVLNAMGGEYTGADAYIKEVVCDGLDLTGEADLSRIEFQDSMFVRLDVPPEADEGRLPRFRRCSFGRIEGRAGISDLPSSRFLESEFQEFEHAGGTTRALLSLPIPLPARVLLTVLKKLFIQAGRGRKESALARGLEPGARTLVPRVMAMLKKEDFAVKAREGTVTIWLPSRTPDVRRRALEMLASPTLSKDRLLAAARDLA